MLPTDTDFFEKIAQGTLWKSAALGLAHARVNRPYIEKSIKDLAAELRMASPKPALVVSGGPSLHRRKHLEVLKAEGFQGHVIAADGSLGHCLRHGVVPDFVLTVDPDPHRIIRWFGDPRLHERPADDYFQRQDIDPELNANEIARNQELIELVDRFGPQITLVISTSASPEITERALSVGMRLYWWNPLYDDPSQLEGVSAALRREVNIPFMTTGGNVGSSCWAFAQAILRADPVYMVGMDFSYPPGTDVYNTQYYEVLKELYPESPARGLVTVQNPILGETWLTDPAYFWYKMCFLRMLANAPGRTVNCTEGGILFGEGIDWMSFRDALSGLASSSYESHPTQQ